MSQFHKKRGTALHLLRKNGDGFFFHHMRDQPHMGETFSLGAAGVLSYVFQDVPGLGGYYPWLLVW